VEGFLSATVRAKADYDIERACFKQASVLARKIAATSAKLIEALEEFDDLGMDNRPIEFEHLPGLVREDSYPLIQKLWAESDNILAKHGLSLFRFDDLDKLPGADQCNKVLTENSETGNEQTCNESPIDRHAEAGRAPQIESDSAEAPSNILDVIYESSQYGSLAESQRPLTIELIEEIAVAARKYTPEFYGAAGAATVSRKNNPKTQYIRSFWYVLQHEVFADVRKTSDVIHALAITATVVLNGPDDDVSYDDVRKALEDPRVSEP
jgi:hypothetical protein